MGAGHAALGMTGQGEQAGAKHARGMYGKAMPAWTAPAGARSSPGWAAHPKPGCWGRAADARRPRDASIVPLPSIGGQEPPRSLSLPPLTSPLKAGCLWGRLPPRTAARGGSIHPLSPCSAGKPHPRPEPVCWGRAGQTGGACGRKPSAATPARLLQTRP